MNAVVAERRRDLCLVAAESAREAIGSQARWPFNGGAIRARFPHWDAASPATAPSKLRARVSFRAEGIAGRSDTMRAGS